MKVADQKNTKVLIPDYITNFRCIGPSCEDTCCIGWTVNIDRDTYKKYQKTSNGKFKRLFKENLTRYRKDASNIMYAKIVMEDNLVCPFIDEDNLCKIHKELGEDYLSTTCSNYPREINYIDGVYEKSCTLSCPEAARLALLNPEGINFIEVEEKQINKHSIKSTFTKGNNSDSLSYYFWDIRLFTLQLMKTREYSLEERLLILGLLYYEIQEKINASQMFKIPQILSSYQHVIETQNLGGVLQEFDNDLVTKIQFMKKLSDYKLFIKPNTRRYKECLAEIYSGLAYDDDIEITVGLYSDVYTNIYEPYMKKNSYILENYIINYMFKNIFPLKEKTIVDSYIVLIIHFAILKTNLIGMLNYNKNKFNEDKVIKLIQSFGKAVEHNRYFFEMVQRILNESNYKSIGQIARLIKDI